LASLTEKQKVGPQFTWRELNLPAGVIDADLRSRISPKKKSWLLTIGPIAPRYGRA
jgi:hypothetical protein